MILMLLNCIFLVRANRGSSWLRFRTGCARFAANRTGVDFLLLHFAVAQHGRQNALETRSFLFRAALGSAFADSADGESWGHHLVHEVKVGLFFGSVEGEKIRNLFNYLIYSTILILFI